MWIYLIFFYFNFLIFILFFIRNNLASKALRYDTYFTKNHTVLPATKHEPYLPLLPRHRASMPIGYVVQRDGQAELTWVVGQTEIHFLHQKFNPSKH